MHKFVDELHLDDKLMGFVVTGLARGEHNGQPAVKVTLSLDDEEFEAGNQVGRLILWSDRVMNPQRIPVDSLSETSWEQRLCHMDWETVSEGETSLNGTVVRWSEPSSTVFFGVLKTEGNKLQLWSLKDGVLDRRPVNSAMVLKKLLPTKPQDAELLDDFVEAVTGSRW